MTIRDYLAAEWRPALGCTEPACIALAAATAAAQASGQILDVTLRCDARMFKNCFAVGIPHSSRRTGLRWSLAIGALITDTSPRLELFRTITPAILEGAADLLERGCVHADVVQDRAELFVDCTVRRTGGTGRTVIEADHTNITCIERDGRPVPTELGSCAEATGPASWRRVLAAMDAGEMLELARAADSRDGDLLDRGVELNRRICDFGVGAMPLRKVHAGADSAPGRAGRLVSAGVFARMSGEDFTVMSLAGSGNKGITVSVPLDIWADEQRAAPDVRRTALAMACLVTSATTHELGSLSAVCGCSNAAGIGLAAGIVALEGGGADQMSLAINNMVGNIAGMICDGAKIGCALKTMTAVDAAFRSAFLALDGIGIPATDGIVGSTGRRSLENLGRVAGEGMGAVDEAVLGIMRDKMRIGVV